MVHVLRFFPVYVIAVMALCFFSARQTGDNIFHFPYHADFAVKKSAGENDKMTRRIFLVVVDGLNEKSSALMPVFARLKKQSAYFTALAGFPSLSRPGYATILTGAGPEITGVSSNLVDSMDTRIDSWIRHAHHSGRKTAFVGLSWWLDFFDADFTIAKIDSGYHKGAAIFTGDNAVSPGISASRQVLWQGKYQSTPAGWRKFIQQNGITETFGDDPATPEAEDETRTQAALGIWKNAGVDFLLLHLQMPDQAGHDFAGIESAEYARALAQTDANLFQISQTLNQTHETLVITADHGFTSSVKDAGHGGHEASSREIPLLFTGAGIEPGMHGSADQRDIAPTLSVLAGLPFPAHNTGTVLENALKPLAEKTAGWKIRLQMQKEHLLAMLPLSQARLLDRFASREIVRYAAAAAVLLMAFFFLLQLRPGTRDFLLWAIYAGGGVLLYSVIFRIFSVSSFYVAWKNILWMMVIHLLLAVVILLTARKLRWPLAANRLFLLTAAVAASFVLTIPWYSWITMPSGLHAFTAIFFQVQCLTAGLFFLGLNTIRHVVGGTSPA